jgi:hypothetical protein
MVGVGAGVRPAGPESARGPRDGRPRKTSVGRAAMARGSRCVSRLPGRGASPRFSAATRATFPPALPPGDGLSLARQLRLSNAARRTRERRFLSGFEFISAGERRSFDSLNILLPAVSPILRLRCCLMAAPEALESRLIRRSPHHHIFSRLSLSASISLTPPTTVALSTKFRTCYKSCKLRAQWGTRD